jgi:hypothetical protein
MKILLPDLHSGIRVSPIASSGEIRLLATLNHPATRGLAHAVDARKSIAMIMESWKAKRCPTASRKATGLASEAANYADQFSGAQLRAQTEHHPSRHQASQHDAHAIKEL